MTVPNERMRALRWGFDLLHAMRQDLTLPEVLRARADVLWGKYPSAPGLEEVLQARESWLPPTWAEALRQAVALFAELDADRHGNPDVRRQLRFTLRHFPDARTIESMESVPLSYWLAPETPSKE